MADKEEISEKRNPWEAIRFNWKRIIAADRRMHYYISNRYPLIVQRVESVLGVIVKLLSSGIFALFIGFLLVILATSGAVKANVVIAAIAAWVLGVIGVEKLLDDFTIPTRAAGIIISAIVIGFSVAAFAKWSFATYNNSLLRNDLRVTEFQVSPYQTAQPVFVDVFENNDGSESVHVNGFYNLYVRPPQLQDINKELQLEDELWNSFMHGMASIKKENAAPASTISPGRPTRTTLAKRFTNDEMAQLQNGTASLYFMGILQHTREGRTFETQYCAFTKPGTGVTMLCHEHN